MLHLPPPSRERSGPRGFAFPISFPRRSGIMDSHIYTMEPRATISGLLSEHWLLLSSSLQVSCPIVGFPLLSLHHSAFQGTYAPSRMKTHGLKKGRNIRRRYCNVRHVSVTSSLSAGWWMVSEVSLFSVTHGRFGKLDFFVPSPLRRTDAWRRLVRGTWKCLPPEHY